MEQTARGIRNNNPGNIRLGLDPWVGKSAEQTDGSFVQFDTPEAGIRAVSKLLTNYQAKYGLATAAEIIDRYAPSMENDTGSYVSAVQKAVGDGPLDLSDAPTMQNLVSAIIQHENGVNPYTAEQIAAGISWAASGARPTVQGGPPSRLAVEEAVPRMDLSPPQPFSLAEEAAMAEEVEGQQAALEPGFWEGAGEAISNEWALTWALSGMGEEFLPDPDFKMTPEFVDEMTEGLPEHLWDSFEDAFSEPHARFLRGQLVESQMAEEKLAAMGWTGVGLKIAAAVVDPVAIVASLATEGVAAPFIYGAKVGRLGKIGLSTASGAVGGVAATAAVGAANPLIRAEDIIWSAAGGAIFGSAAGAFRKTPDQIARGVRMEAALRSIQEEVKPGANGRGGLSAQGNPVAQPTRVDTYDIEAATDNAPTTAFGAVRYDSVGQAKSSENGLTRALGGELGEDAVGNADHSVNRFGATETQAMLHRSATARWAQTRESSFRDWWTRQGRSWTQRSRGRVEFFEEAARAKRSGNLSEADPAIRALVAKADELLEEYQALANNPGLLDGDNSYRSVRGFGDESYLPNYVPRKLSDAKWDGFLREFGTQALNRLHAGALRAGQANISQDLLDKLAPGYVKSVTRRFNDTDGSTSRAWAGEDMDRLSQILKDDVGLKKSEIKDILDQFGPKPGTGEGGRAAHARARHRVLLDEDFSMPLTNLKGETRVVHISDLWENNLDDLMNMYSRQISGAVALARVRVKDTRGGGDLVVDGITSPAEFDTLLGKVNDIAFEKGIKSKKSQADAENLRYLYNSVAGIPHEWTRSWGAQVLRRIRDFNFVRVMNQVGWAQLSELGNIVGQTGFVAAYHSMPSIRALLRDAKTGKIKDEFHDEMEGIFGIGADRQRGIVTSRYDDFGESRVEGTGKIDDVLNKGKRITADISGMAPINTVLHRWTSKAIMHRFSRMIDDPRKGFSEKRLASLGLSPDMTKRILKQMKAKSSFEEGMFSSRQMKMLNIDQWGDAEAASHFRHAVSRLSRRIIQENDPGMMHRWMSNPLAQVMLQFRSFMLGSWSKMFLNGIHMRDNDTLVSFGASMVAASLAYTSQTYLRSVGRSDQEEYLEKRLSKEAIGKAAFQRAGFASLFPMAIDTIAAVGGEKVFDYRSTGLPSDAVFGNPSLALYDQMFSGSSGIATPILKGRAPSQQELRNFWGLMPFQNAMPIQNIFNAVIADNPQFTPKD